MTAVAIALAFLWAFATPAWSSGDLFFDKQWAMEIIGAPEAWSKGTGEGVVIATVDSGVDLEHEDLRSQILHGKGMDFVGGDNLPQGGNGHGTHVAGIAAGATGNGKGIASVAPGAKILPVRVFDDDGFAHTTLDTAIEWAAEHGADVINVSAGTLTKGVGEDETLFGPEFRQSIEHAWSKGVIVVLAAGNDFFLQSGYADIPAIVVAATDRHDRKPDFSSGVGEAKWGMAAPGGSSTTDRISDDIYSTYYERGKQNSYDYLRGTSMAAPFVSGAAAVLRGMGLGPRETVDRLLSTAKDLGPEGRDPTFGYGRLDLAAAVGLPTPSGDPSAAGTPFGAGGATAWDQPGESPGSPQPPRAGGPPTEGAGTDLQPAGGQKGSAWEKSAEDSSGGTAGRGEVRNLAEDAERDERGASGVARSLTALVVLAAGSMGGLILWLTKLRRDRRIGDA